MHADSKVDALLGKKKRGREKTVLAEKEVLVLDRFVILFFCLCILTFGGGDGILILTWKQGKRSIIVEKIPWPKRNQGETRE